jgi:transcriptional regulator with XRE-family HTH domain
MPSQAPGIAVDPARVREARLESGLSLADLAGEEVSRTMIHFVEHGRARPSRRVLDLIAKRTHKPVSFFLLQEDSSAATALDLSTELLTLATRLRRHADGQNLTGGEHEAVRLLEMALRQGASLVRAMGKSSRRKPRDQEKRRTRKGS